MLSQHTTNKDRPLDDIALHVFEEHQSATSARVLHPQRAEATVSQTLQNGFKLILRAHTPTVYMSLSASHPVGRIPIWSSSHPVIEGYFSGTSLYKLSPLPQYGLYWKESKLLYHSHIPSMAT